MSDEKEINEKHLFKDTEFGMHRSFKDFTESIEKLIDGKFTNADAIRSLEDDHQLALYLWNLPKFQTIEELHDWLCKEHMEKEIKTEKDKRCKDCISWHRKEGKVGFEKGSCEKKPDGKYKRANQKACKKFRQRLVKF